jgi:FkbM family methyltransferase
MNLKQLFKKIKIYGIKNSLKFTYHEIIERFFKKIFYKSYSQEGEDLIIDGLLGNKNFGYYIDIGANDPERFSNTKRFYDKGWRGINIEPDYNNYLKFLNKRPEDLNLNIGISSKNQTLKFYKFNVGTISTFSEKDAENSKKLGFEILEEIEIKVITLKDIMEKYVKNDFVDFLSVDTEGHDLEVLKSNDWDKYRPKLICIENHEDLTDLNKNFLEKNLYKKVASTDINSIYIDIKIFDAKSKF